MDTILKISPDQSQLASDLAEEIASSVNKAALAGRSFSIALSGGSTPKLLFSALARKSGSEVHWDIVHFFWGDERCVPPHDPESNFGMANRLFLEKVKIRNVNIHRIIGEDNPEKEAERYSLEILRFTRNKHGLPLFDMVILGLGDDGHTASIFPGQTDILTSGKICSVATHPVTGQKRITITGPVINNADTVIFVVSGAGKAEIVAEIIEKPGVSDFPAAAIEPSHGVLKWYLDIDAASMLDQMA
jgi:6-phosphogluconolactonase